MTDGDRLAEIKALADMGNWMLAGATCEIAEERAALRDLVTKFLPVIRIENGIEVEERPLEPDDHVKLTGRMQAKAKKYLEDPSIYEAAELLVSGALDTEDGNPSRPEDEWAATEAEMRAFLKEVAKAGEVTEGDGSMSRAGHARRGVEALDELATVISWARAECADPEEVAWLDAIIADVARVAFVAGRHAQAAWGKNFEADAVTGDKCRAAARERSEKAETQRRPTRERTLDAIEAEIGPGVSWWKACDIAAAKGLGTSADANRKMVQRHRPDLMARGGT